MSFLYDETTAAEASELKAHLETCAECRAKVDGWGTARQSLNTWQTPVAAPAMKRSANGALKWALAASVVLLVGFTAGRISQPNPVNLQAELAKARQEIAAEVKAQLQSNLQEIARTTTVANQEQSRQLFEEFLTKYQAARAEDQQTTVNWLRQMEERHKADFAWLRKDLETVAVMAEDKLNRTALKVQQLTALNTP
jgi:hypothetical protein